MNAWRAVLKSIAILTFTAAPATAADFYGMLPARDLSPFGFLRLDMRPAHEVSIEPGSWALETAFASQNTWAMSPAVERYLTALEPEGRRTLGETELAAIRALPGENYLIDLEMTVLDVTFNYKFSPHLTGYLIASAASYEGGLILFLRQSRQRADEWRPARSDSWIALFRHPARPRLAAVLRRRGQARGQRRMAVALDRPQ